MILNLLPFIGFAITLVTGNPLLLIFAVLNKGAEGTRQQQERKTRR